MINNDRQTLGEGYTKGQARFYSTLVGASEAGLEAVLGGVGKLTGVATKSFVNKIPKVQNAILNFCLNTLGGAFIKGISEFTEEFLQVPLETMFRQLALNDQSADVDWGEAFYSGLLGFLTSNALSGVPSIIKNTYYFSQASRDAKYLIQSGQADSLVSFGKTFDPDSYIYKTAQRMADGGNYETLDVLDLMENISGNLESQNRSDLKRALLQQGMPDSKADKAADILMKVNACQELNKAENRLFLSEPVKSVYQNMLLDKNSVINARNLIYLNLFGWGNAASNDGGLSSEYTRQLSLAGVKNAEEVGLVLGKADTGQELSLQEAQSLAECPPALDLMIGNYMVTDLSLHPTGEEIQVAVQQTRQLLDSGNLGMVMLYAIRHLKSKGSKTPGVNGTSFAKVVMGMPLTQQEATFLANDPVAVNTLRTLRECSGLGANPTANEILQATGSVEANALPEAAGIVPEAAGVAPEAAVASPELADMPEQVVSPELAAESGLLTDETPQISGLPDGNQQNSQNRQDSGFTNDTEGSKINDNEAFTYKAHGQDVTIENVKVKKINYTKRSRIEEANLRRVFNNRIRRSFLKMLSNDTDNLVSLGFTDFDIEKLKNGKVPIGHQVHHVLPLDDGGDNSFENLTLIKNYPYHIVITNYQRSFARAMKVGETREVEWPFIEDAIYRPNKKEVS